MRKNILASAYLLAVLLAPAFFSQLAWASVTGWSKIYGGPSFDNLCSMAYTSDGGYILAGYTNSFGSGLWLVKTDAEGKAQWNKTYSGVYGDDSAFVIQADDEGYVIASYCYGPGRSADYWLIKTDAFGNVQWNKTYGGASFDMALSIIQTHDKGYALAGYTDSFGGNDILLVKTNADGTMEWNITYPLEATSGSYLSCSLISTSDGGYALATTAYFSEVDYDIWLAKTDVMGNLLWNKTYGGVNSDYVRSIRQTYDGGYILAGMTYSYGVNGDCWLVKSDAYGNEEWNMTYGGMYSDIAYSVIQTTDGGYMFVGITDSFGDYNDDFWLVKTDSQGNAEWDRIYDIGEDEIASSLTLTTDGGYAFAGTTCLSGSSANMCLIKTDENGIISELLQYILAPLFIVMTSIVLYAKRGLPNTGNSKTK